MSHIRFDDERIAQGFCRELKRFGIGANIQQGTYWIGPAKCRNYFVTFAHQHFWRARKLLWSWSVARKRAAALKKETLS